MPCQSLWDRMKTKNFYMILLLVAVSTMALWILSSPSPNLQTIINKTHSGIRRASNIQMKEQELTVDPMYLRQLGLTATSGAADTRVDALDNKIVNSEAVLATLLRPNTTASLPVVASAVTPDQFKEAAVLMKSIYAQLPGYRVVMYDLGLSAIERALLVKYCNVSWNCETVLFQFEKYPSHVKYLNTWTYRPICIQEILSKHGAVIWVDGGHYFVSSNLSSTLNKAKDSGIQGWTIKEPTSSFTHTKMFRFFNMNQGSYFFQHAVESSHLVLYNTDKVTRDIMLPWVKCALIEECISPPGAQNSGCNYLQRPLYKYTGCHRYDMSALNIILGKAFQFDEEPYTNRDMLFGSLVDDKMRAENRSKAYYEIPLGLGQQIRM